MIVKYFCKKTLNATCTIMLFRDVLLNPLANDKILDQSNLKDSADDKINVAQQLKICIGKKRKHCGKRKKMLIFKNLLCQGH